MKSRSIAGLMLAFAINAPLAGMAAADAPKTGETGGMKADNAGTMSSGEIRKVDKDAGKVTIKHGPLANLEMPAMTMVFRVKDPAMLDQIKQGDKINFSAEKLNDALTVTAIEAAK